MSRGRRSTAGSATGRQTGDLSGHLVVGGWFVAGPCGRVPLRVVAAHRCASGHLVGDEVGSGHRRESPDRAMAQNAEVNHTTASTVVSRLPSTGSVQPDRPGSRSASILAANTP